MAHYLDGLNFVPLLERQISPPSSSRSRVSLTKKLSRKSLVYYNGNYEGDTSMFKAKSMLELKQLNLLENNTSDSEIELEKDRLQRIRKSARMVMQENQAWRLIHFFMMRFLRPGIVMKITQYLENIYDSFMDGRIRRGMEFVETAILWIFCFLKTIGYKISGTSSILLKSRTFLRRSLRRLLWWMTLQKGDDLWSFTLVLFCTPWLFLVAIMGFVLSLYCSLKECIQQCRGFIRRHAF